jgi:hypothetical protein
VWRENKKPSMPKSGWRVSENPSGKLDELFSSFLRGASCLKSPRVAATAGSIFMLENRGDVNIKWYGTDISAVMRRNFDNEMHGTCVKQRVIETMTPRGRF